jgi:hypothetical protein
VSTWIYVLVGLLILEHAVVLWWFAKTRLEVRGLHWRLNSIWKKVGYWHSKIDRVTGELRRVTGEQISVEMEGAEEFDDTDRRADTRPTKKPRRKKRKT